MLVLHCVTVPVELKLELGDLESEGLPLPVNEPVTLTVPHRVGVTLRHNVDVPLLV